MKQDISIVIPNYNGVRLLHKCISSAIKACSFSKINFEIIVSDDGSIDESVNHLKTTFPEAIIVTSDTNTGFSGAANRGIQRTGMPLVFIMNNDVTLAEDYFESQFKHFQDPDLFGVMGSIWSEDGKKLMDAAKLPVWKSGQLKSTVNYFIKNKPESSCPTLFLSGANALVRREMLVELGGFDERFNPFYMEDVELSVKAWRKGWKCIYEPKSRCYHKLSETISKTNQQDKVKMISRRNKFLFHHKHLKGFTATLWQIENLINLASRWMTLDFSYYRSYFDFKKLAVPTRNNSGYSRSLREATNYILDQLKKEELTVF